MITYRQFIQSHFIFLLLLIGFIAFLCWMQRDVDNFSLRCFLVSISVLEIVLESLRNKSQTQYQIIETDSTPDQLKSQSQETTYNDDQVENIILNFRCRYAEILTKISFLIVFAVALPFNESASLIISFLISRVVFLTYFKPLVNQQNIFTGIGLFLFFVFLIIKVQLYIAQKEMEENQTTMEKVTGILSYDKYGHILYLDAKDLVVSKSLISTGIWEQEMNSLWPYIFKKGNIVVSLGVNVGSHMVQISDLIGDSGKIYCLEANPEIFKYSYVNKILNDMNNIELYNKAAYDANEQLQFAVVNEINNGQSFVIPKIKMDPHLIKSINKNITVEGVKLDDLLANVEHLDVIQMDIEGSEILAIQGALKLIERSPNITIIQEWLPYQLARGGNVTQYIQFWRDRGFSFIEVVEWGTKQAEFEELMSKVLRNVIITKSPEKYLGLNFSNYGQEEI